MPHTPLRKTVQTSPILIAEKITLHVSREKDGKLRVVYAGWDDFSDQGGNDQREQIAMLRDAITQPLATIRHGAPKCVGR